MAAEQVARAGIPVVVYDAMPSPGRKFLMAGRGGLNLTHSEDLPQFLQRYGAAEPHLRRAIETFSPRLLRDFSAELGEQTFIGSSGRVFPKAMKASPLLRAWLRRLDAAGVRIATRHRWTGWDSDGALLFETAEGVLRVEAEATVLALGGASWPRLGSDGGWVEILRGQGIAVEDLRPANCGFLVEWSELFKNRFEGAPLKRVALTFAGETVRGEIVITRGGLEGVSVYALSCFAAQGDRRGGRGDAFGRSGAGHGAGRPDEAAGVSARQELARQLSAQGSFAVRGGNRTLRRRALMESLPRSHRTDWRRR